MADTEIRAGDTLPPLDVTLTEGDGTPVPWDPDTEITVRLRDATDTPVLERAGVTDPSSPGRVILAWQPGDTDTPGIYTAEWTVTGRSGTRTFPLPSQGPHTVNFEGGLQDLARAARLLDPDVLADGWGLSPLTGAQRRRLLAGIAAAIRNVEGYLRRPVVPVLTVDRMWHWGTDDQFLSNPPLVQVISQVIDPVSGMVVLTYLGGISVEAIPLVREFIEGYAVARYRATAPMSERDVTALTVEGQSKTFTARAAAGSPGGVPDISTLARFRRGNTAGINVYSRRYPIDPYIGLPYVTGGGSSAGYQAGDYGPGTGGYVPVAGGGDEL